MATQQPPADPADPTAVEYAAELIQRSSLVRLSPGTTVSLQPSGRFPRQGVAYAVSRLRPEETTWLAEYQRAAKRARREQRELERERRRGQL